MTRPAGTAAATVQDHLRFLRSQGLDCVAEPISLDGDVETLRYIPGASGGDSWYRQHTDEGLASAARLLTCDLMRRLAESGQEPQRTWVLDGALDREREEIEWVCEHRDLLSPR